MNDGAVILIDAKNRSAAFGRVRSNSFPLDLAVTEFASCYADQNERDYRALEQAVARGRIVANTGI